MDEATERRIDFIAYPYERVEPVRRIRGARRESERRTRPRARTPANEAGARATGAELSGIGGYAALGGGVSGSSGR
jgi:hypothetical protein